MQRGNVGRSHLSFLWRKEYMKTKKNSPSRVLFSNNEKKRNIWLFDAGLHTLHMEMRDGEQDMEFVERYLKSFFKGCKDRGGDKYRYFFIDYNERGDYVDVWGVK